MSSPPPQTSGSLLGFSLAGVLQILVHEGATCSIHAFLQSEEGRLHLTDGQLYGAEAGGLRGRLAALHLMTLSGIRIEIGPRVGNPDKEISQPLQALLLEAAQLSDERASAGETQSRANPLADISAHSRDQASQHKENAPMANVKESLASALQIDGAMAAALVDYKSGMCLGQAGTGINLDLAAAGNTEVVRAKLKTMMNLGIKDSIEDILITLNSQYHIIRLLTAAGSANLFLYLVLDRGKANLAMARHQLSQIEGALRL